jgi:integrase
LARGDVDAVQLTGKDRLVYGRALDAIKATGVALDAAATEYAQAAKALAGHSLMDAANFYMRHQANGVTGRMVSDAIEDFRQAKSGAGRSSVYLKEIRYRLGSVASFQSRSSPTCRPRRCRLPRRTQAAFPQFNNQLSMLRTFFRFCQARGWLSKHADLLSRTERRSATGSDIDIFTPKELRALLAAAPPHVAICLAIQAFAGVRTAELLRLTWHDLERRPGYIEVTARQAKTAARRLIPLSENLAAWLRMAPGAGRLWTRSSNRYFVAQQQAASRAGMTWKANALRHSFISYRIALTRDIAAVALEAGNSPKMIFAHYRELCTEQEAAEWFSIMPAQAAGTLSNY